MIFSLPLNFKKMTPARNVRNAPTFFFFNFLCERSTKVELVRIFVLRVNLFAEVRIILGLKRKNGNAQKHNYGRLLETPTQHVPSGTKEMNKLVTHEISVSVTFSREVFLDECVGSERGAAQYAHPDDRAVPIGLGHELDQVIQT